MPRRRSGVLPLAPLLRELGPVTVDNHDGRGTSWKNPNGMASGSIDCALTVLAELLGISQRTVMRWKRDGVPVCQADRAACALGRNPLEVWGDGWWNPTGEQ